MIEGAEVRRVGRDVTVVALGPVVVDGCLAAAVALGDHGVEVEVVELPSPPPVEVDTVLNSVAKTKNAVIVHDESDGAEAAVLSCRISEELFSELEHAVRRSVADPDAIDAALRHVTIA